MAAEEKILRITNESDRVITHLEKVWPDGTKTKVRRVKYKYLCLGGKMHGKYMLLSDAQDMGYDSYNASSSNLSYKEKNRSTVLVHEDVFNLHS